MFPPFPGFSFKGLAQAISTSAGATPIAGLPPGPRYPAIYANLRWQFDMPRLLAEGHERFGDIWTLHLLGGVSFVFVSDPKLIEDVFEADPTTMGHEMVVTQVTGTRSLLTLSEPEHEAARRLLAPPFHREGVQRYGDMMMQITDEELDRWPLTNEAFPSMPTFIKIALRVIVRVLFGATGAREEAILTRFEAFLAYAGTLGVLRLQQASLHGWKPPRAFARVSEPLDELLFEEIEHARRDPNLAERDDVTALLVQATHDDGKPLGDREIRDHLVTLTLQGHRSTGNALAWTVERLTRHPDVLEKLVAEIDRGDGDGAYLDAVLKESLRVRRRFRSSSAPRACRSRSATTSSRPVQGSLSTRGSSTAGRTCIPNRRNSVRSGSSSRRRDGTRGFRSAVAIARASA